MVKITRLLSVYRNLPPFCDFVYRMLVFYALTQMLMLKSDLLRSIKVRKL